MRDERHKSRIFTEQALFSLFFLSSKNSTHFLEQNPSGKNIVFRDDLDLVTVVCLRTHPHDFLPHRSPDKRASARSS